RRAVVRGKSLAEAAAGRAVEETPPFAATDEIPGVGRVKAFADAAFALREGEASDLVETDDAVYLLTPFVRTEAHLPPLDEVRDRKPADMSGLAAAKDALRDSLFQQKRQAIVRGYVDFLKESALRAGRLDVRADLKG